MPHLNPDLATVEQYVLGIALYKPDEALPIAFASGVTEDYFTEPLCFLWKAIGERYAEKKPCDLAAMAIVVDRPTYLILEGCVDVAPPVAHLRYYLRILQNRRMVDGALDAIRTGEIAIEGAPADDVESVVGEVRDALQSVTPPADNQESLADLMVSAIRRADDDRDHILIRWPTGDLNRELGPLTGQELVYIGGQASCGKTAFALNLCCCLSHAGHISAYRSIESSREQIGWRLLSMTGNIDTLRLRRREATQQEKETAASVAIGLREYKINVCDLPGTVEEIRGWAVLQKAAGARVLVIDCMRHIRCRQRYDNPVHQFRDLSAKLKQLRDDVRMPVIVLHHAAQGEDRLSWSQDIRNDADTILFLKEDEAQKHSATRKHMLGYVDKNREGHQHITVPLLFKTDTQTFEDEHGENPEATDRTQPKDTYADEAPDFP